MRKANFIFNCLMILVIIFLLTLINKPKSIQAGSVGTEVVYQSSIFQ